jgi:GT2 family glycosyltransferase
MLIYSVVVTYNGIKWLDKCFGSLFNSTVSMKILAIDNKSTDGTPDQIRLKYPSVEIIETGQNLGFGRANNIGLTRALNENADYVFLLNQDAWVEIDTIEKLVSAQSSEYAILSPVHFNGQGNSLDFGFANYLLNSATTVLISDIYLNRLKPIYEMQYVNAAAWLLNMKCVELVGGFDPSFFMYGEDGNYLQRVKYYGLKVGVCLSTKIYHDRQFRIDKKWEGLYGKKIVTMNYFKDLNKSLIEQSIRFLVSQSIAALKDILRLSYKNVSVDIYMIVYVIVSFREIVSSRKQAKTRCAFLTSCRE